MKAYVQNAHKITRIGLHVVSTVITKLQACIQTIDDLLVYRLLVCNAQVNHAIYFIGLQFYKLFDNETCDGVGR